MATNKASVDCLEGLLKNKPFPKPFRAREIEECGVSVDVEHRRSAEISTMEVARLYLTLQGNAEPSLNHVSMVKHISHLRRLGQSFLDGEVSARMFCDIFLSLYHQADSFASSFGFTALRALGRYWIDIDAYPDSEDEKRQEGFTDDRKLKETAREVIKTIDDLWKETTRAELSNESRH